MAPPGVLGTASGARRLPKIHGFLADASPRAQTHLALLLTNSRTRGRVGQCYAGETKLNKCWADDETNHHSA